MVADGWWLVVASHYTTSVQQLYNNCTSTHVEREVVESSPKDSPYQLPAAIVRLRLHVYEPNEEYDVLLVRACLLYSTLPSIQRQLIAHFVPSKDSYYSRLLVFPKDLCYKQKHPAYAGTNP